MKMRLFLICFKRFKRVMSKKLKNVKEPYVSPTVTCMEISLERVIAGSYKSATAYQDTWNDASGGANYAANGTVTSSGDTGATFGDME
jgi:hypothetical protein